MISPGHDSRSTDRPGKEDAAPTRRAYDPAMRRRVIGRMAVALLVSGLVGCTRPDWIQSTLVTVDVSGSWQGNVTRPAGERSQSDGYLIVQPRPHEGCPHRWDSQWRRLATSYPNGIGDGRAPGKRGRDERDGHHCRRCGRVRDSSTAVDGRSRTRAARFLVSLALSVGRLPRDDGLKGDLQ